MPVTLETPRAALGETLAGDTQLLGSTSLVYEVRADIRAR